MIRIMSNILGSRNSESREHILHIKTATEMMLRQLVKVTDAYPLTEADIALITTASSLHDIGKIRIPEEILNKPGRLTDEEFRIMKTHSELVAAIIKDMDFPQDHPLVHTAWEICRWHHERYDGNGYPDGLKGKEIPLHARIVAVADSYDAMSSQRIYRNQLPPEKIIQELENNKGTQFDPEITDIFLKLLREDRIHVKEDLLSITENTQIPEAEIEMSQFISDIMSTIRTQKTKENLDFLTGLPTRNKGEQAIAQLMKRHSGCLVFMDMDNLKTINDIYGHKAGDRVLKLLGNLLLEYSSECLVCRLGGDEFLLFMPNADQNSITEVITAIFKKFNTRKEQDPELHAASISAGLYMCNIGDSFDECYTKADKALYFVKQNGKSDFSFYRQISESGCDDHTVKNDLSLIAKALRENGNYSGVLDLDYREFAKIYEYIPIMKNKAPNI